MPGEYTRLTNVLDSTDLLYRWPGVSEDELAAMVKDLTLPAYSQQKQLKAPDGQVISFCTPGTKPWEQWQGETTYYDWGNIVFDAVDVERLEKQHPELTWPVPGAEERMKFQAQGDNLEQEWVCCDTLARRWGWSPFDVLAVLGPDKWQLRYNIPYSNRPPSCPGELSNGYAHIVDLLRWEAENADKIHNAPVLAKDGERLRDENKTLAAQVAWLEEQNAAHRSELEIERAKPARTGPPEHLERAKDEKTAERWKRNMRSGLTLAVHVFGGGKAFTTEELRKVCSTLGLPALGEDALKIFRETMPPECINTGGRPSKKKNLE